MSKLSARSISIQRHLFPALSRMLTIFRRGLDRIKERSCLGRVVACPSAALLCGVGDVDHAHAQGKGPFGAEAAYLSLCPLFLV